MDVRSAGRIMALVIPSERSAEGRSQREQPSNRKVECTPVAEQDRARVLDAATGSPALEGNCPDVVERRVAAQVESLKVSRLHAHAHDQFSQSVPAGPLPIEPQS